MWEYNYTPDPNELYHYGVLGMKWGVRRYQNKDGSLTNAGRHHYYGDASVARAHSKLLKWVRILRKNISKLLEKRKLIVFSVKEALQPQEFLAVLPQLAAFPTQVRTNV